MQRQTTERCGLTQSSPPPLPDRRGGQPSKVHAEASVPRVRGQLGELRVREPHERRVVAGLEIDVALSVDRVVDDGVEAVALADRRNCAVGAIVEQLIDLAFAASSTSLPNCKRKSCMRM